MGANCRKLFRPHRRLLALTLSASAALVLVSTALRSYLGSALDGLLQGEGELARIAAVGLVGALLHIGLSGAKAYGAQLLQHRMRAALYRGAYRKLLAAEQGSLSMGEVSNQLSNHIAGLLRAVDRFVYKASGDMASYLFAAVAIALLHPAAAVIAVGVSLLPTVFIRALSRREQAERRQYMTELERVEEILTFEREELEQGEAWDGALGGGLDLKNVSVCFTPEKKLSIPGALHLPAGAATALYGDSGCGKTSLLKTIMGFYPYEGEITLGNRPLRAVSRRALRSRIAYLPQQTLITAGSVRDNLTLGCRRPVGEREIGKVLGLCTCDEWIAQLPEGLDTRLEEGGLRLSFARTLLRDADTILLDEAFSAIDKGRAAQIMENLHRAYPEKTVIAISHEASVRQACGRSVSVP